MVYDISKYKSHPNKLLLEHISGVQDNIKRLTNSKLADLVAIFHDLGKMNPNFQEKKLVGISTTVALPKNRTEYN